VCWLVSCLVGGRPGALHTALLDFYTDVWPGISCGSFGESGLEHLILGLVADAHQTGCLLESVTQHWRPLWHQ
jgi:hypothetical protein